MLCCTGGLSLKHDKINLVTSGFSHVRLAVVAWVLF